MKRIAELASGASDVDPSKVMAIKDALFHGTYRIDPQQIADKLIHMDTALQRGRRRGQA